MNCNTSSDKMVTVKDGAIICPNCRRKVYGIRLHPGSTASGINLQCRSCGYKFDIDIPGQRHETGPRH